PNCPIPRAPRDLVVALGGDPLAYTVDRVVRNEFDDAAPKVLILGRPATNIPIASLSRTELIQNAGLIAAGRNMIGMAGPREVSAYNTDLNNPRASGGSSSSAPFGLNTSPGGPSGGSTMEAQDRHGVTSSDAGSGGSSDGSGGRGADGGV